MPDLIENVGSCAMLKVADAFNLSVGDPKTYYYSTFQQLFKFIPQISFRKSSLQMVSMMV
jgi:hypothetical protein